MTPEEFDRFLNQPFYSLEVSGLLTTLIDFLEYSEKNLNWQRREAVRMARVEAKDLQIKPHDPRLLADLRSHIIESAENRFDFGLSQSVRYAGLVAFVTSIDWCARLFADRLSVPLPKGQLKKLGSAGILEHLDMHTGRQFENETKLVRNATKIRNCVVHSAGIVKGDEHESEIREVVGTLDGFQIVDVPWFGDAVHINKGAVEALARDALRWVPVLDEQCTSNATFRA